MISPYLLTTSSPVSLTVCGSIILCCFFFFFNDTATTEIYTLSLHDALPIFQPLGLRDTYFPYANPHLRKPYRSEEHTSELQSHHDLVCRLLLEKKKKIK